MLFFAKAIIMHEIPFSMVDFPYFKSFIHSLQFFLNLPAPKSVMSACMKVYKMEKIKVQDMLNSIECWITLACDVWTSLQNVDYIVMTAHFTDDKWKLQKSIIGFSEIDFQGIGDHTVGEYMFDCIFKKNGLGVFIRSYFALQRAMLARMTLLWENWRFHVEMMILHQLMVFFM